MKEIIEEIEEIKIRKEVTYECERCNFKSKNRYEVGRHEAQHTLDEIPVEEKDIEGETFLYFESEEQARAWGERYCKVRGYGNNLSVRFTNKGWYKKSEWDYQSDYEEYDTSVCIFPAEEQLEYWKEDTRRLNRKIVDLEILLKRN